MQCKRLVLEWFEKHSMVYLEKQYLSNGERGLDLVKNELKLLLLQGMAGDEWEEDR